ncbi:MAG: carboxypeptidase-like regulatory domain-containing protein [Prevotella sp.]|jgi:hypothetical protein|nr:carboxypeptidase-like regulatory domain-containing protein [Prevotella sp.]
MKKVIISFFLVVSFVNLYSQKITGTVYDNATKEPIPEVSVYLNNTTYNTQTNSKGEFELSFDKEIVTDLVISRVGYNMISIPHPYDGIPEKIFLTSKSTLDEIIFEVPRNGLSRREMLKMFKTEFLGNSHTAQSCKIQNEDDIELFFDYKNYRLTARSENPIVITNQYLGYVIKFELIDFYAQYDSRYHPRKMIITATEGKASFNDLNNENNKKINKRRKEIYNESRNFFFKNLANKTLYGRFAIASTSKPYYHHRPSAQPIDSLFIIKDTLAVKKISLTNYGCHDIRPASNQNLVSGRIHIADRYSNSSYLTFISDSFFVDKYGNAFVIDGNGFVVNHLIFSGFLGGLRMGDTLPQNYEP